LTDMLILDDRSDLLPGDKSILIVEGDNEFAQWLLDKAHDAGFKAIVTPQGHTVRALARKFAPTAVAVDTNLPDLDGWKVLERLKADLTTRHIPVIIMSARRAGPQNALKYGAIAALKKPINVSDLKDVFARVRTMSDTKTKKLLVIEDDAIQRRSICELIGNETTELNEVATAGEALAVLRDQQFDCVLLDLMLPDMSGFDLIEQIRAKHPQLPVIVYTGKDLSRQEEERLNRVAQTVIVKDVRSPERLFDQTALWLHWEVSKLPKGKRDLLQRLHDPDEVFAGKKVLIVDDDIRNIFAMTSVLERYKMNVISAETGKAGIEALQQARDIDLVLMDIMLPEMDGYDTMRTIRKMYGFEKLPIIALTAKAMKGDREKCIDAGASDYIAKPVETEELLTLLRNWFRR